MDNIQNPSLELAYIVGIAEDAYLGKGGKIGYVFDIESKSKTLLENSVASRLSRILNRGVTAKKPTTRKYYRIRFWDRIFVKSLTFLKDNSAKVLNWTETAKLLWTRGFIDAEGSVVKTKENQPMLSVYNSDVEKLRIIEKILKPYGIRMNYYKPPKRRVWQQYYMGRENLTTLLKTVEIEHPVKNRKLRSLLRLPD